MEVVEILNGIKDVIATGGGSVLLVKLYNSLDKAIGNIFEPKQIIRRMAAISLGHQRAKFIEAATESLLQNYRNGLINIDNEGRVSSVSRSDEEDVTSQIVMGLCQYQASRDLNRYVNLQRIGAIAIELAKIDVSADISHEPIGEDWLFHWRNCAQDIQQDQMQEIFAKILVEEGKKPGSFCKRTLDFLVKLDQKEAKLIEKIGLLIVDEEYVFAFGVKFLQELGISYDDLLELEDLNILKGVLGEPSSLAQDKLVVMDRDSGELIIKNGNISYKFQTKKPQEKVRYSCYKVSRVGRDLSKLLSFSPCIKYLLKIKEYLESNDFRFVEAIDDQGVSVKIPGFNL
jgi:hypothetical protein